MSDAHVFLAVLAKVMHGDSKPGRECDRLYTLIASQLSEPLNQSHYPKTPEVMEEFTRLYESLESAFLCKEFFQKVVYEVDGQYINKTLSKITNLFLEDISDLCRLKTVIPYVFSHAPERKIVAVNYDNQMVDISAGEMQILVKGCYNYNIDITKIIRFFKVGIPLFKEDVCLIVNDFNHYKVKDFTPFLSGRIIYEPQKYKTSYSISYWYDAQLVDTITGDEVSSLIVIEKTQICEYLSKDYGLLFYGYSDECHRISSSVLMHYEREIQLLSETCRNLTDDIIRMKGANQEELKELRKNETSKKKLLEDEEKVLKDILSAIGDEVANLANKMEDTFVKGKYVSRRVFDSVLFEFFNAVNYCNWNAAKNCQKRLNKLGYPELELLTNYLNCMQNNTTTMVDIDSCNTWSVAKMFIAMTDISNTDMDKLGQLLWVLGERHIETGKELYLKALLYERDGDVQMYEEYLKKSFECGYSLAGNRLIEIYGNNKTKLTSLVNALVPEACMKMAQKSMGERSGRGSRLSSDEFVFYKLAASKEYLPAIGEMVDVLYSEKFCGAYQIIPSEKDTPGNIEMRKIGQVICTLCRYLIDKYYEPKHYQEILGVVIFCMNENLMESMRILAGINTPVANYCKGCMYEFGQGVPCDFDAAIIHYERAVGFVKAQKRLEKVRSKKIKKEYETRINSLYDSSNTYTRQVTSTKTISSNSSCFITTAACVALEKGDDCKELNLLRKFRDERINDTISGQSLVLEYYRIAPHIVEKLDALPDAREEYYQLWTDYISPSCREIEKQNWEKAKLYYIEMVKTLCKRFEITLVRDVLKMNGLEVE